MPSDDRTINLRALVPSTFEDPGLVVYLGLGIRLSKGTSMFTAEIYQRRTSQHGRDLKPRHVFTLAADPGESMADLLRSLAALFEAGEIPITNEETADA
jgi:hypothetical protein